MITDQSPVIIRSRTCKLVNQNSVATPVRRISGRIMVRTNHR